MLWAWVLCSPRALGTRPELRLGHGWGYYLGMDALVTGVTAWAWMGSWFGHGCSVHRMLLEHERDYGLGMDGIIVRASMNYGLGMDGIIVWA